MSVPALGLGGVLVAVASAVLVGRVRPAWSTWAGAAGALLALGAAACAWAAEAETALDLPWIAALGSRLVLGVDDLAGPIAVFAAGLAACVQVYAGGYLAGHPARERARLAALLSCFLLAMVLLVTSQDLLVSFAALELTALVSYFCIRFDRSSIEARRAAALAFLVTVASSLVFLCGVLLVARDTGTTSIPELARRAEEEPIRAAAALCLAAGLLAKSAQVPLHVWLPRAMVAPVPVSAYLHSAALVAAGVFVLQRLRLLLDGASLVLDALACVGLASIAVGATLALASDGLKRILAYSTIAQHGYALVLVSSAGPGAFAGVPLFLVAHGLCKAALFMTAGAVTRATGAERLSEARGALRGMPLLAAASGVAAAGLVGLPATVGFAKEELFLAAAGERGPLVRLFAGLSAAATCAYVGRFWLGLVTGRASRVRRGRPSPALVLPVVGLAVLVLSGGILTAPLRHAAEGAGRAVLGAPVRLDLHAFGFTPGARTLAAWAAGALLLATLPRWRPSLARAAAAAGRIGPTRALEALGAAMRIASDRLHRMELRDVRDRLGAVLVPTAVLLCAAAAAERASVPALGRVEPADLPLVGALAVACVAAVAAALARRHLALILLLSFAGFSLALAFALAGAPDVALVVVLVESTLTLLFLAVLSRLRETSVRRAHASASRTRRGWAALGGGAAAFLVAWTTLASRTAETIAARHVELAPSAHARDVVTAILADFRGLDTAGELSVLAVAVLGAAALAWGRAP